jgi:hypothetical protein
MRAPSARLARRRADGAVLAQRTGFPHQAEGSSPAALERSLPSSAPLRPRRPDPVLTRWAWRSVRAQPHPRRARAREHPRPGASRRGAPRGRGCRPGPRTRPPPCGAACEPARGCAARARGRSAARSARSSGRRRRRSSRTAPGSTPSARGRAGARRPRRDARPTPRRPGRRCPRRRRRSWGEGPRRRAGPRVGSRCDLASLARAGTRSSRAQARDRSATGALIRDACQLVPARPALAPRSRQRATPRARLAEPWPP